MMLLKSIPKLLSSSQELVAIIILMEKLRNRPAKNCLRIFKHKTCADNNFSLGCCYGFRRLCSSFKASVFTLSAFSQTKIIEHYEAFFMLFWTLCAVIKSHFFTICAQHCIHQIFPKLNRLVGEGCSLYSSSSCDSS